MSNRVHEQNEGSVSGAISRVGSRRTDLTEGHFRLFRREEAKEALSTGNSPRVSRGGPARIRFSPPDAIGGMKSWPVPDPHSLVT